MKEHGKQIRLVPIASIRIGKRHRTDHGDIAQLASSIEGEGLLQPIGITHDRQLVFGERRLRAFKHLGRAHIPTAIVNVTSILAGELAENVVRKDFVISERVAIMRSCSHFDHGGDRRSVQAQKFALDRHELARRVGLGNRETARQAVFVVEHAVSTLCRAMDAGTIAISVAAQLARLSHHKQRAAVLGGPNAIAAALREERRERRLGSIHDKTPEPLDGSLGKFPVILADPPWRFQHPMSSATQLETNHYPTLSLDQICALPVRDLAADDSILFLWTPASLVAHAVSVIGEWGFSYRTCAIWDKGRIGMGCWFLAQHEVLLLATHGKPPTPMPKDRVSSIIRAPREQRHSKKPPIVHDLIERWYPGIRKLELFARQRRDGWTAWGMEVPSESKHRPFESQVSIAAT
jgi:N6-adenosine-specific RNA methylase IME4/ParB-like chromosome segregation protein Spo0J